MQRYGVIQGEAFWYVVDRVQGFKVIEVAGTVQDAYREAEELNQQEPCPWTCGGCYYIDRCEMKRVVE